MALCQNAHWLFDDGVWSLDASRRGKWFRRLGGFGRLKRRREAEVWGEVIDQVGAPPEGATWVHVMDRGADNFEVYLSRAAAY